MTSGKKILTKASLFIICARGHENDMGIVVTIYMQKQPNFRGIVYFCTLEQAWDKLEQFEELNGHGV